MPEAAFRIPFVNKVVCPGESKGCIMAEEIPDWTKEEYEDEGDAAKRIQKEVKHIPMVREKKKTELTITQRRADLFEQKFHEWKQKQQQRKTTTTTTKWSAATGTTSTVTTTSTAAPFPTYQEYVDRVQDTAEVNKAWDKELRCNDELRCGDCENPTDFPNSVRMSVNDPLDRWCKTCVRGV